MSTQSAPEITLKEAVQVCGKSEKTLRRKIDAGLLKGTKEPLDYGGFMWMINLESLDELYPGSAAQAALELEVSKEPPPTRLDPLPSDEESDTNDQEFPGGNAFLEYLLEENRNLKEDIRERDCRIDKLQETQNRLERALGEQEGTASTQNRVLEWFQNQERPALPPGPQELPALEPPKNTPPHAGLLVILALLAGFAASLAMM